MGDLRGIRMTWRGEPGRAWTFEIACSYLNGWELPMTTVLMTQFLNAHARRSNEKRGRRDPPCGDKPYRAVIKR
jgi:hypothetical protein